MPASPAARLAAVLAVGGLVLLVALAPRRRRRRRVRFSRSRNTAVVVWAEAPPASLLDPALRWSGRGSRAPG